MFDENALQKLDVGAKGTNYISLVISLLPRSLSTPRLADIINVATSILADCRLKGGEVNREYVGRVGNFKRSGGWPKFFR
jgi:hypothetical protein